MSEQCPKCGAGKDSRSYFACGSCICGGSGDFVQSERCRIKELEAYLRQVDEAISRRPAMDKETRAANIEHACRTAQRETDRANVLEAALAKANAENERLREVNAKLLGACKKASRAANETFTPASAAILWHDLDAAIAAAEKASVPQ